MNHEAEEIGPEELHAAAEAIDALDAGDFYERQEAAHRWMIEDACGRRPVGIPCYCRKCMVVP